MLYIWSCALLQQRCYVTIPTYSEPHTHPSPNKEGCTLSGPFQRTAGGPFYLAARRLSYEAMAACDLIRSLSDLHDRTISRCCREIDPFKTGGRIMCE